MSPTQTIILVAVISLAFGVIGVAVFVGRQRLARHQMAVGLGVPEDWRSDPEMIRKSSFAFMVMGVGFMILGATGAVAALFLLLRVFAAGGG